LSLKRGDFPCPHHVSTEKDEVFAMAESMPNNEIPVIIQKEVGRVIKGLSGIIRLVTIAIFAQGHILLKGLPGVAKTTLLRAFSKTIGGGFSRISGTPDLMPTEFLFTMWPALEGESDSSKGLKFGDMAFYRGPLLTHGQNLAIMLLDEINRIQPKSQSAFLEVMQEGSVTFGVQRFSIPHALFVATRNPLETEETFELPEAQKDRFMFEGQVPRPDEMIRRELILNPAFQKVDELIEAVPQVILLEELSQIRKDIQQKVNVSAELAKYITALSEATWRPGDYVSFSTVEKKELNAMVRAGLSPRAEILLAQAGRVVAWMNGRNFVLPADIQEIFLDVCTHRFFLSRVHMRHRTDLAREMLAQLIEHVPAPRAER
jgi:MoxR-like ATPase